MFESEQPLSPTGEQRRREILRLAHRAAARRKRNRVIIPMTASATILAAVFFAIHISSTRHDDPAPLHQIAINPPPASQRDSHVVIERIETDPGILARLSIPPSPPRWKNIDDDELIETLAAAGQSAGLIRTEGKTILLTSAMRK